MKINRKINQATIVFILALFILIQGCDNSASSPYHFKVEPKTFSEELFSIYQVTPDEAMEWMYDSSMAVFVDIRAINEYENGHLENALNIPITQLLAAENKVFYDQWLRDSSVVVLYGNNQLEANAPWMLMYQLGYTNMRVLLGGYGYIDRLYLDALEEGEVYTLEDPAYDYAGIIEGVKKEKELAKLKKEAPKKQEVKKPVVVQKKEKKASEGGC